MREASDSSFDLQTAPLPELVARFCKGEADAVRSQAAAEILRRFEPLFRKYFRRIGQPADDYGDFVQEVMLRTLIALPRLRDPHAFPGLMRDIVIGTAADVMRKRMPESVQHPAEIRELATIFDTSISTALIIRSCLEMLSPREREVMELLVVEDLDVAEAAHRLAMTDSTVRMVKSRAIKRLRQILAEKIKGER